MVRKQPRGLWEYRFDSYLFHLIKQNYEKNTINTNANKFKYLCSRTQGHI